MHGFQFFEFQIFQATDFGQKGQQFLVSVLLQNTLPGLGVNVCQFVNGLFWMGRLLPMKSPYNWGNDLNNYRNICHGKLPPIGNDP